MVTVTGTGAVRCTGTVLRAAVLRVAVTGGLTLLAWLFGSAVANAATATAIQQVSTTGDSIQLDVSGLVNGLISDMLSHHSPVRGGISVTQPPADSGPTGSGSGSTSSSGGDNSSPTILGSGNSGSSGASGSGGDVWTGSTTVTVPVKSVPPVAPAPPVAPPPVESHQPVTPPPAPVVQHVDLQAATPTELSMGTPSNLPGEPQPPVEVPLQQPASQPVSSQSTGSTSHDLGSSTNGLSGTLPLGTGFRPTPGSTTDEHAAKRVSDGVPGLPSTSPD